MRNYAKCLYKLDRYEESEIYLLQSYKIIKEEFGADHERTQNTLDFIIDFYRTWGKPEKVAEYEAFTPDAISVSESM